MKISIPSIYLIVQLCALVSADYIYVRQSLSWSDAENYCVATYGTHLATINNEVENIRANSVCSTGVCWIGLSDAASEGKFLWSSTNLAPVYYTNWAPNQPNNVGNEDCATIGRFHNRELWNDETCHFGNYFLCDSKPISCRGSADYKVALYGTWSSARQPLEYPSDARFSPITGASHNEHYEMWYPGGIASTAVQNVAELGENRYLLAELSASSDVLDYVNSTYGAIDSTRNVEVEITVSEHYPLLSFIAMSAPSPDWFISFRNIDMCDGKTGKWKEAIVLDKIFPYDAGTDSGSLFTSPNHPTHPPEPIYRILCGTGVFCEAHQEFLSLATFTISLVGY